MTVPIQDVSTVIDPTILAKHHGLRPDRSAYYLVHTADERLLAQFCDRGMLVTVLDNQTISREEIDEIELIDADTFDD